MTAAFTFTCITAGICGGKGVPQISGGVCREFNSISKVRGRPVFPALHASHKVLYVRLPFLFALFLV